MSLVRQIRAILDERRIRYILIGAHAAGIYGVIRSTKDVDFLTVDRAVLDPDVWSGVEGTIRVLRGDASDPLAGTVRATRGQEQVDVVVGKWKFELAIIERAEEHLVGGLATRVPRAADLVLLKLAAGGPQDMWDIHELFRYVQPDVTRAEVEAAIETLPSDAQALWERIRHELP